MADGGDGRRPPLLRIGSRIVVDGHYGTVRYVGAVDSARPDAIFYGVEWDDPLRGRHSGEHNGVRLFECRMPGAGSFVRATPKVHGARCSIAEAVVAKYADKEAATAGHRGMTVITTANDRKAIEMIGFEGILAKQSNLAQLETVELVGHLIDTAGDLHALIPNVTLLDLSNTLLPDWPSISAATAQLPRLSTLLLNGLRLPPYPTAISGTPSTAINVAPSTAISGTPSTAIDVTPSIAINATPSTAIDGTPSIAIAIAGGAFAALCALFLNHTMSTWPDVVALASAMPHLEQLHVADCALSSTVTAAAALPAGAFACLTSLNIEGNALRWDEIVAAAGALPRLTTLVARRNAITRIAVREGEFAALQVLHVNRNDIDNWESVDALNGLPFLRSLRISDNPIIMSDSAILRVSRELIIARIERLQQLNGSDISEAERADAERYAATWITKNASVPFARRAALLSAHALSATTISAAAAAAAEGAAGGPAAIQHRLVTVKLCSEGTDAVVERRLPNDATAAELRAVAMRALSLPRFSSVQLHVGDDVIDDDTRRLYQFGIADGAAIRVKSTD